MVCSWLSPFYLATITKPSYSGRVSAPCPLIYLVCPTLRSSNNPDNLLLIKKNDIKTAGILKCIYTMSRAPPCPHDPSPTQSCRS